MSASNIENDMMKFEKLLIDSYVLSGSFHQLANSTLNRRHNFKRLLLIAIHFLLGLRYLILIVFNNVAVSNALGDVLWTMGILGLYTQVFILIMAVNVTFYLCAVSYCEYHGQLAFLNDLTQVAMNKSEYSIALNSKVRVLHRLVVVVKLCVPYVNGSVLLASCTWNAFQTDHSIQQALYNTIWGVIYLIWAESFLTTWFGVSALVYLYSSLIILKLNTIYDYLKLCKDPFTLNTLVDQYNEIIETVNKSNRFIKLILLAVNFIAVPMVSLLMSMIKSSDGGILIQLTIGTGAIAILLGVVSTSAFMASLNYKVLHLKKHVLKANHNELATFFPGTTTIRSTEFIRCTK